MKSTGQEAYRESLIRIGFDEVRFVRAQPVPRVHAERFASWIKEGNQADMSWMTATMEKRLHPEKVLSGAQSIVLLGVNYLPESQRLRKQERWAKYSLYSDYHDTIKPALKEAGRLMEEQFGIAGDDYRYYTDTGPLMERGWAARAGMGFQGKNGMLISFFHGNWLFLSAILSRVSFIPDPPLTETPALLRPETPGGVGLYCGTCTQCLDACPTGAIEKPGLVNARLCISYQTIENRGVIPRDLRPLIGKRIFGCDICLDICPWNRLAKTGRQLILSRRYDLVDLTLSDLLSLDQESFSRIFSKSPVKRLKLRGLLRNACVVAGNLKESPDSIENEEEQVLVPLLVRLAESELPLVRLHAVWAIHRLVEEESQILLARARIAESDPDVLEEYAWWKANLYGKDSG